MTIDENRPRHCYFITGRLAEHALRAEVEKIAESLGFSYTIGVMPITVAALITPRWLTRHWKIPEQATEIILPGYCDQELDELRQHTTLPIRCGPRDLRDLYEFFRGGKKNFELPKNFSIEVIAEINHAPRLSRERLLQCARELMDDGADVIDLGCDPARNWFGVGDAVRALKDELGARISIDTFDPVEAKDACRAGAELVLSVNSSNREQAIDFGAELVAIPDNPTDLASLETTIEFLQKLRVPFRIDLILEPIGCGFVASLERFIAARKRFPDLPMMMGIGNLTELTDVDSAGINLLLLAICEELRIGSVLTTQVINWSRSSVRECAYGRRLVHHAVSQGVPPKHLGRDLIRLRDPRLRSYPPGFFADLANQIKDHNYRLFAQDGLLHSVSAGEHFADTDPFSLFEKILKGKSGDRIDPSHAFYLGFELSKAVTALTLGKQYEQDEALHWGDLTRPEKHHRLSRSPAARPVTTKEKEET